jgi:hypothetical protein
MRRAASSNRTARIGQDEGPEQGREERPQHGDAADRQDDEERDHHDLLDALLRFHAYASSIGSIIGASFLGERH